MQDLEKLGEELRRSGQAEKLKGLAATAEGQRLGRMVDRAALSEALRKGDTAALQDMMGRLLRSDEGQRLSAQLQKLMREKPHG